MVQPETLIQQIRELPQQQRSEVADFVEFLAQRGRLAQRRLRDEALAGYVAQWAGTEDDLDPALEQAGLQSWLAAESETK